MVIVKICIGSSCHIKGSHEIVEMLQNEVEKRQLEGEVVLMGSFCLGQCNRIGVTVQVDDDVYPGITKDGFQTFFEERILSRCERK